MSEYRRLATREVARFVARGYLMFEALTPPEIAERYLEESATGGPPAVPAGTPLAEAYPEGTALRMLVDDPGVRGILDSLVGPGPLVDHHFVHLTLGEPERAAFGLRTVLAVAVLDAGLAARLCADLALDSELSPDHAPGVRKSSVAVA